MSVSFDVVSIGCLSSNRFWNEPRAVRASLATTTLLRDGPHSVLVDPSLPAPALERLLHDRTGLRPAQIDAVFLSTFRPVHRRGLPLFDAATVLMSADEIAAVRDHLARLREDEHLDAETRAVVRDEAALLDRIEPAPDKLSPQIHLFPTPGPSPGSASLLLVPPTRTIAVAGDAILHRDYFERGQVFDQSFDLDRAKDSFAELLEIAEVFIPGHDNVILPLR